MSVRIRLARTGKTHHISFRIVAQDARTKRDGKFLEILGSFNPQGKDKKINLKMDRFNYWLKMGARPTEAINKLLSQK